MPVRGLIVATQFLTRLPTPAIHDWRDDDLAKSANWFPVVGLIIGIVLAMAAALVAWLAPALLPLTVLAIWIWITGALHLDGLSDTADGLGAAHKDADRFLDVARDPHVGSFGVIAIVLLVLAKFQTLGLVADSVAPTDWVARLFALALIPAIARLIACWTAWSLPPFEPGLGGGFRTGLDKTALFLQTIAAIALAVLVAPMLLVALPLAAIMIRYWQSRLGGVTGDILGATIEISETILLIGLVVAWQARLSFAGGLV